MKTVLVLKKGVTICVCAIVTSILLVPVQAANPVPAPHMKPSVTVKSNAPVPVRKPVLVKESVEVADAVSEKPKSTSFSLKLRPLFTSRTMLSKKLKQNFPHGYEAISAEQSKLYAKIFDLQMMGKFDDALIAQESLEDYSLMGHILAQKYLHPNYKSSFEELSSWMDHHADHPDAKKIYKLAVARRGDVPKADITNPDIGRVVSKMREPTIYYPKRYKSTMDRTNANNALVKAYKKSVLGYARTGDIVEASDVLVTHEARALMDQVEVDMLQAHMAEYFLYAHNMSEAYNYAKISAARSGYYVPKANWVAGIAAWQLGSYTVAAAHFEKVASSPYASGWMSSAGSFWAARSYKKTGKTAKMQAALNKASQHSYTFYGLLAAKAAGKGLNLNWEQLKYSSEHESLLLAQEAGKRAFSLVGAGQYDMAEAELLRLNYKKNKPLQRAVLAYASHVGLPGVALRLGNLTRREQGGYYDSAMYPVSPWSPEDGFTSDPALIHAIIRQESRFNQRAVSHSGARGLMQIMPKTAMYVAKNESYGPDFSLEKMAQPEINMKVGQDYIEYLLKGRYVKGDMVALLVAYNAGPGNLNKWRKRMGKNQDPLLFIEMMPVHETRDYVERVLANYWIYRDRAGLESPSLVALSKGKRAKYAHIMQEDYPYQLAGAR